MKIPHIWESQFLRKSPPDRFQPSHWSGIHQDCVKCVQYKRRVAHGGHQGKEKAQQRCCYDSEEVFLLPRVKHKLLQFLHLRFSHLSFRFFRPHWPQSKPILAATIYHTGHRGFHFRKVIFELHERSIIHYSMVCGTWKQSEYQSRYLTVTLIVDES